MNQETKKNQTITDFQQSCQKYMVCFTMTRTGLAETARLLASTGPGPESTFTIGKGHPNMAKTLYARIKVLDAIEYSKPDGDFSNTVAKSFITAIFSEWNELYRPQMAREFGVGVNAIKSDLMGDLRVIRHCIVHNKSQIVNEHTTLRELRWKLSPGSLSVTHEMFAELIYQINAMLVRVETT